MVRDERAGRRLLGRGPAGRPRPLFALLTLIRAAHATPESDEAGRMLEPIAALLGNRTRARIALPLPLPPATFLAVLPEGTRPEQLFPALIRDRRTALFYYGAMSMEPGTRAFIASQPDLARKLAEEHAGAVAAFGRSLRVESGRLVVSGGEQAVPAWEELVDESIGDTPAFVRRLFSARDGRTAYLFDTIAQPDPARQRFALARLQGLHRAFADVDPEWSIATSPFTRPMHDAAQLLRLVPVDGEGAAGHVARALERRLREQRSTRRTRRASSRTERPSWRGFGSIRRGTGPPRARRVRSSRAGERRSASDRMRIMDLSRTARVLAVVALGSSVGLVAAGAQHQGHDHGAAPMKPVTSRGPMKPHVGPLPPIPYEGYPSPRPMQITQAAYEFAARHPEVLQYVPCFCGCERGGHAGNHDCFVRSRDANGKVTWDSHGYGCAICIDVAYSAMQMFNSGASPSQIRTAIDQKYASRFPTATPTPKPPTTSKP